MEGISELLQLDNVADGFRYERRFELFFNGGIFGFVKLSELVSGPNNKREGSFEKENDGGHLCEDIGSLGVKDSGFV